MKFGRWLIMAVLASFAAILLVSSVAGQGLKGANSAVIFDYEVTNDGGILFADEYDRLGGVDTLGYPASYRFELDGFTYQVTQRALLQWRSNIGVAYLGNIFEMLEHAGLDQWLLESKGIPLPIKDDGSNGDWNKARETRLSWLTNEQIKAKFLANPNPDAISDWNVDSAINLYGLPMSMPEKHGPFISQRFQRVAFQLWVDEVAGSPAPGTVIGVLAGDLLKEAGLVPPEGLNVAERPVVVVAPAPAPAPAPSTSQPRATAKPRATATATAEATAVPTVVATPPAANLTLSSLSLGDVGLSPAFDADTTTYTANADNEVESVTVTAEAASEDAAVVIKLNGTVDDDGTVELADGDGNVITIDVTVGDATATYTVTVTRASATPAEGAVLSTLSLSDVTLSPGFSADILNYTASVVHGIARTTITATIPTGARIGITPADVVQDVEGEADTQGHQVDLAEDADTTIDIAVTSGDDTTFYKIVISRGASEADATLSNLVLSDITLSPAFSRHTYSYTATVASSDEAVTVTPTDNADSVQTIVYRVGPGQGVVLSNTNIPLTEGGTTTIRVEVTSADTNNTQTYTINITRLASGGLKDTTLVSLSLADIDLSPAFTPGNRNYTATTEYADAETTVAWMVNTTDAVAEVIVNGTSLGAAQATGTGTATLAVGQNFIKVRVTSPDASTIQDYDIRVTREAYEASDDATLASIQFSPELTLSRAFNKDVTSYTARVGARTTSVDVTPAVTDASDEDGEGPDGVATFTVSPSESTATPYAVSLNQGDNVITIEVTAEDGTTKKVYSITVTRGMTTGTDDATLHELTLTDTTSNTVADQTLVTLTPSFQGAIDEYTAEVAFETEQVTIDTETNIEGPSVVVTSPTTGVTVSGEEVTLVQGENEILVTVTITNPAVTEVYKITVNRLARVDSSDATLSGITLTGDPDNVTGQLAPAFNKDTRPYTVRFDYAVTSVTVVATATDDTNADVEITPEDAVAGGDHQVNLDEGDNIISIEVTAEDGSTKTYEVTVIRRVRATDSSLSALTLKDGETDELNQTFSASRITYTSDVASTVESLALTATASESSSTVVVMVSGATLTDTEGVYTVAMPAIAEYEVTVTVTAENPANVTTYTITVDKS